jgi:basic amino acid/polyamine antiporter, APA family
VARRKHREGQSLHKVLGVPALFSTAYGNVGSSIYYALGVVAAAALGATPIVFLLTGLLFMATAWSYAEATAAMPEAGGASSFARRAFNEAVSFGVGWGQMLVYTATIAISALFVPQYLSIFWAPLRTWPYNTIGGIIVTIVLVVINIIGIKEAARINVILALLDLGTQILIVIIALVLLLNPRILIDQVQWGTAPTWKSFLLGIAIGTVAYTGIETVSNMAEEASNPGRDVPRAINYVIAATLIIYISMPLAGLSAMTVKYNDIPLNPVTGKTVAVPVVPSEPEGTWAFKSDPSKTVYIPVDTTTTPAVTRPFEPESGSKIMTVNGQKVVRVYGTQLGSDYAQDPVLGIVRFMPDSVSWLRAILGPWVGILAATILFIATNAGIIGVSRLTYSLGQHRQLPPVLGRVHPKRLTPFVSIIVFGIIACLLMLPGQIQLLADVYVFGSMISFTAAHVSVIALRIREPNLARPWQAPLNVGWHGVSVPLTAVFGGIATFLVWLVIVYFQSTSRIIGFAWFGVGFVMYVVYRKYKGYSLTKTVEKVVLPQGMLADIDYNQILVPIVGSRVTDEMMVLACQLATEKSSSVDALFVIEVPMNVPLDASLTTERGRADRVLKAAGLIASQFNVPLRPHIVTARSAGKAIVEVARDRHSEVIILGSLRKRRIANRVFGTTTDYVLQHAPCEVIVNLVPAGYPELGSGGAEEAVDSSSGATPAAANERVGSPQPGGNGGSLPAEPAGDREDRPGG